MTDLRYSAEHYRLAGGDISMQFSFDRISHHFKSFMDPVLKLILTETVGKFHLHRGMITLTGVLSLGRDLFAVRSIEFQHNLFSFK